MGGHRRGRASASGGSSSSSRSTASTRSSTAMSLFMDYGEQVVAARARRAAEGPLHARGGAGQRRRLQRDGRDHRRRVHRRPARQPRPGSPARTTPAATASMIAAQMVFKNVTEPHGVGERRARSARSSCSRAPGSVFDAKEPAAFAIYYEVEVRLYDLIWRCLAPHLGDRLPAGQLRVDLRHVHRRAASRHRPPLHDRRAADRRLGRLARRATATARSSAASTATRSTARPRSPRRATGCTSTGSR